MMTRPMVMVKSPSKMFEFQWGIWFWAKGEDLRSSRDVWGLDASTTPCEPLVL